MTDQEFDNEIEDPRSRTFDHKKNSFTIKASDPYGFWTIGKVGGKLPENLSGQYTTYEEAKDAIVNFYAATVK